MRGLLEAVHKAIARRDLTEEEAHGALEEILDGDAPAPLVSALLVALRMKGETVDEAVGFARAMRARAQRVECNPGLRPLVDTCGTGGDGSGTFNVSTAVAFVVAGAGARVAKHGNRSISSRCGSADVLEELGARVALPVERIVECIAAAGIGFLFAPALHPAMAHVQPIRAALKMRTIFNLLGPLTNPAGAEVQVVGIFDPAHMTLMAEALARLGVKRALVVHGTGGLDEISTTGPTQGMSVQNGALSPITLHPEDFGVQRARLSDLGGGGRSENAAIVRSVLQGEEGPRRDLVLVNAAATLVAAGLAPDFGAGMAQARWSIDSGRARETLNRFVQFTNS
jgi:anthranilate phosphoribosyltransferase